MTVLHAYKGTKKEKIDSGLIQEKLLEVKVESNFAKSARAWTVMF